MILSLQKQVANLTEHLKENAYKMEGIESMNIDLLIKNRNNNEELQRILKELLDGEVFAVDRHTNMHVKEMGEIDSKSFRGAWMKRLPQKVDELSPSLVCSKLQQEIQNLEWYPFKIHVVDEKSMLKADHGEEIYGLVTKALCEIIKYNASGRYTVNELWNFKEDHKVSPDEVVQYLMKK
ncbi:hypothetical protein BDA96_10G209000 [Sorghum bicolor]|uniref:Factor of DNA methylation 1-5/IDN2 domain-containing protein n=1 Tax=Sorghum bicolor TaxID=4558 RepID=A0A921Q5C5_SORBI|nr:hypothetical protein BDA96_10G209000 [Sorghum bicolor]